jgi:putative spermidine/putrescine transport system substrate-binding protein
VATTPPPPSLDQGAEGALVVAARKDAPPLQSFIKGFERSSGCAVKLVLYGPDEWPARVALDRGATIDVALVRSTDSPRLIDGGAVAPLATDLLEHRDALLEPLRDPAATSVGGREYGIAFDWALDVLVSAPSLAVSPSSLEALLDPRYQGQIAMPDDLFTLASAALLNGAQDPYALTASELEGAGSVLAAQRPMLAGRFATAPALARLLDRGAVVALASSTVAGALAREGKTVAMTLPSEGTTGWFDSWLVTTRTRHPVCAYRWLNAITAPEAQASLVRDGLAPANGDACTLPGPGRCDRQGLATAANVDRVAFARTPVEPTTMGDWRRTWGLCCPR